MLAGRGFVSIPPDHRGELMRPYSIEFDNRTGPIDVYMVSVFHQLHCLVSFKMSAVNIH